MPPPRCILANEWIRAAPVPCLFASTVFTAASNFAARLGVRRASAGIGSHAHDRFVNEVRYDFRAKHHCGQFLLADFSPI